MKTLLIYDTTGFIYVQMSGDYRKPEGLKYIEVEVPTGKLVDKVLIDADGDYATFRDVPKTELEKLQEQLDNVQSALDDVLMGGAN